MNVAAAVLNLIAPGAGLIVLGQTGLGLLVGGTFAICANVALWAVLLIPAEFSPTSQALWIGLAGGAYCGAQVRLAQRLREVKRQAAARGRRRILAAVQDCLNRRDFQGALQALQPLREADARDLLVTYRLAQIYSGLGDDLAAQAAWAALRQLDRDGIYRRALTEYEGFRRG